MVIRLVDTSNLCVSSQGILMVVLNRHLLFDQINVILPRNMTSILRCVSNTTAGISYK